MNNKPKETVNHRQVPVVDEQHAFADEMDFLGVKPLPGVSVEVESPEADVRPPAGSGAIARRASEEETFLEAVGVMEKTFKDEWPEQVPTKLAVPRRMRQVARGQLKPEAELDLHGLTVDEASVKLRFFLQGAAHHGFQTVLVITGRGLHSSDGPVLRQAMEALMAQLGELVLEWGGAPRQLGGEGALVVFLRRGMV